MISPLEAIAIRRADEQMRAIRMDEPVTHDRSAIAPSEYQGRADGRNKRPKRDRCLACDRKPTHGSYCKRHWERWRRGVPVDSELYTLTTAERKRLSTGVKFGFRLAGPRSRVG